MLYVVAIVVFSWMTFAIIRGNFQRKFNEDGERIDLVEKEKREREAPLSAPESES
jgi:hypothetical protein